MDMCSNCKQRPAVVFCTVMRGTEKQKEGLCLVCAKKLNIPHINEHMAHMGITDEDIDEISEQVPLEEQKKDTFNHTGGLFSRFGSERSPRQFEHKAESMPSFIHRLFDGTQGVAEQASGISEQQLSERDKLERKEQEKKEERCSFCRKGQAMLFSRSYEYGLCIDCIRLFYPYLDIIRLIPYNIPIEEARMRSRFHLLSPNQCKVCKIRDAQIYNSDGNYCVICAKKQGMREADLFAKRMGISDEDLTSFVQQVDLAEQSVEQSSEEKTQISHDKADSSRFQFINIYVVNEERILILLDKNTGVQYLTNQHFSVFSPLLGADGKPLLYK